MLRQLVPNRLHGMPILLHTLCKLADVIEIISDLDVVIVDIPASSDLIFIPCKMNLDLAAVRDAEKLLVFAVDEANTS